MYITKDENTLENIHRFSKIRIQGKPYEVQAVDSISVDGIIEVALKEDFENTLEKDNQIEENNNTNNEIDLEENPYIEGEKEVYPYEKYIYTIKNASNGTWSIDNEKKAIIVSTGALDLSVEIEIITGKKGYFNLIYSRENEEDIVSKITIQSL